MDLTEDPASAGSSSHFNLKVMSPVPLAVNIVFPSGENLAPTPGEVERIVNSVFITSPSSSLSFRTLPSPLTSIGVFVILRPPNSIGNALPFTSGFPVETASTL